MAGVKQDVVYERKTTRKMNAVMPYSLEVRESRLSKWVLRDPSLIVLPICVLEPCGNVKNELREWTERVDRLSCLGTIHTSGMNITTGSGVWASNSVLFALSKPKTWNQCQETKKKKKKKRAKMGFRQGNETHQVSYRSGKLNYSNLHPQADPKIRNFVLSSVFCC